MSVHQTHNYAQAHICTNWIFGWPSEATLPPGPRPAGPSLRLRSARFGNGTDHGTRNAQSVQRSPDREVQALVEAPPPPRVHLEPSERANPC